MPRQECRCMQVLLLLLPPLGATMVLNSNTNPAATTQRPAATSMSLVLPHEAPPPRIVPRSPSRFNNSGAFDVNTGESSLFLWSGAGPHRGQLMIFETINSKYPDMPYGPRISYYRLRNLDTGVVVVNISESQHMGFGSAFMDHDHGRVWLFGCNRGASSVGIPADRGCGVLNQSAPDGRGRPWDGTVWALWSIDLMHWEGPELTDVAWSGPNTATARVRGPTHPSLPEHRYVMVTEGLSVAVNNDPDGNLTRGWISLPQCPQAEQPFPGWNSWAYTACTENFCHNASIICNQTQLPPMPAAQGLGACPAVKYLPQDQYYYVIFGGAPFVYLARTKDFASWEQPQQPFIQPSAQDANSSPYVGNPETMARDDAPEWWRVLAKWDWNSNDSDMCCENWEPSGVVAEALANRTDGQRGWVIWAPSSQGKGVLAAQSLASSQHPLDTELQSYFPPAPPQLPANRSRCNGILDCSLNGDCAAGRCVCYAGWTGSSCGILDLEPAKHGEGLFGLNSSTSSWGNMVQHWPTTGPLAGDGRWYMAADIMDHSCGMHSYGANSRCVMAVAENVSGPYEVVGSVLDAFCHGSSLARDPLSGRWIHGHLGDGCAGMADCPTGDPRGCLQCSKGVTPASEWHGGSHVPCTNSSALHNVSTALIAESPLGPWRPIRGGTSGANGTGFINTPNAEPFFLRNGTLFFRQGWNGFTNDSGCNGQQAFSTLARAETLQHALAGNWTFRDVAPRLLGAGTNKSTPCINWEGGHLWLDRNDHFHSIFHAWRAQPTDYPAPGCGSGSPYNAKTPTHPTLERGGEFCTSLGGHAFSIDGLTWYVSPVAPWNNTVKYDTGETISFRARERVHFVYNDVGEPIYLGTSLGNPPAGGAGGGNGGVPGADHAFVQLVRLKRGEV